MNGINSLLKQVCLPPVCRVQQRFDNACVEDVEVALWGKLQRMVPRIGEGSRIAITCGSRGIDSYVTMVRTVVRFVRQCGGVPFLVPAMGSHGGATAEGQQEMLRKLGITEESTGAPICSSMDTVQVGTTTRGLPVFIDRYAAEADGLILLNRIKPHTSFRGPFESGLLKMLAVGLANQRGAEMTHFLRFENMAENIVSVGKVALDKLNILFGVASIENGYGKAAELHVLGAEEIVEQEPALLQDAFKLMPRIYLDEIDALIVGEIGKEISGTGMDTNIVGRFHTGAASGGPHTIKLGLLDLSKGAGGNANGMGLADFVTRKLYEKIDFEATYFNSITSTEPNSTRLPMVLDNDKLVMQACIKLCGQLDPAQARVVLIGNTKNLAEVFMSPAAVRHISNKSAVTVDETLIEAPFDGEGNLLLFHQEGV